MARPEGAPPARVVDAPADRLRWCVTASGELAQAMMLEPAAGLSGKIAAIGDRYARALDCSKDQFEAAVRTAQSHLQSMAADLGIDLKADSKARRLLPQPLAVPTGSAGAATAAALGAGSGAVAAGSATGAAAGVHGVADALTMVAAPPPAPPIDTAGRMLALEDGIASVTQALAGDTFRLNEVLKTILQTMHKALGFRCVVFGLRDSKTGIITGRFGLGAPASTLSAQFRVDVNPNGPVDLLSVACKKAADTLISDALADNVRSRLPTWLQREAGARSFVLLPMTMKSAPFALIYADCAIAGGIVLGERELGLLRTLRNQAVMAFKTAG